VISWVLLITMLFFSSLGFKVLENAISVISGTVCKSAGDTFSFL